jgi:hypothetical protein
MKSLKAFILISILTGALIIGCGKETIREITGPTEYDTTTVMDTMYITEYDTTIVIDTVAVFTPTKVHAYAVSQVFLDNEIMLFIEAEYDVVVTGWMGFYSNLWNASTVNQTGNVFDIAGICTPLFTCSGLEGEYYDIVEYSDLELIYVSGDPSDPDNWTASWTASTTTFKSRGMLKR